MTVSLVVPFSPDGAERSRNWAFLKARYEVLYPGWQIVEADDPGTGGWSKGRAVAAALEDATGDVCIVADADVMVSRAALAEAVGALEQGAAWVIPHRLVYRLTQAATQAVFDGTLTGPVPLPRRHVTRVRKGPAGGGLVVADTESVREVGGIDPRFLGWGGEDISFGRALDTLIGEHTRLADTMWHLHHPPMGRRVGDRASEQSELLASRYLEANGDPVAMRALCDEQPYQGVAGGGIVVAAREVVQAVPPDPRFVGWG